MKANRPNRRLPPLAMTAEEFDRLAAVAEAQGVNMALFAKRAVMRAVSRQEAFASLSASDTGQWRNAPQGPENGTARPVRKLNGHAAQAASTDRNTS